MLRKSPEADGAALVWVVFVQTLTLGALTCLVMVLLFQRDPALIPEDESQLVFAELDTLRDVPRDEFVFVNAGSPLRWVLGPGFSIPESDGAWVNAHEAKIIFSVPEHSDGMVLEISMSPLLVGDSEVREVTLGSGSDTKNFLLGDDSPRPVIGLPDKREQEVVLECESLDSPSDGEDDMRRLCVKVYGFVVHASSPGTTE